MDDENKSDYGKKKKDKFTLCRWCVVGTAAHPSQRQCYLRSTLATPGIYKSDPEACGFTANCCKVAPCLHRTQKLLQLQDHLWCSFVLFFFFFYTCAFCVCLIAGVCSGICVHLLTNINIYDPVMSIRDWKTGNPILWTRQHNWL